MKKAFSVKTSSEEIYPLQIGNEIIHLIFELFLFLFLFYQLSDPVLHFESLDGGFGLEVERTTEG